MAVIKVFLSKLIRQAKRVRVRWIDDVTHSTGVWENGAKVWATVFCCPYGRAAICTVFPREGCEQDFFLFLSHSLT